MTIRTTPITPYLEEYLSSTMHPLPDFLVEIFESGDMFGKKDMQISLIQAHFLRMLVTLTGAKRVLEVGTYVGFSAASFASASPQVTNVVTCEITPSHCEAAHSNFSRHSLADKIRVITGDAKNTLGYINGEFDIFFLDGDKENYDLYLPYALKLLPSGGLFIVDNTLFKGEVIGGQSNYSQGIRRLMSAISLHPNFDLSHVTIGDGMLIARKR